MQNENNEQVVVENNEEDTGIVTHSLESDMRMIGVGVDEESSEGVQPQKEGLVEEEPKKLSRKERRVQKLANTNKELRERVAELESKETEQSPKEEANEIDIDDFESYDDYVKALEEQEKTPKEKEPVVKESKTETVLDVEAQQDMLEDGVEDYENFEELVMADDLALTENVLGLVLETENSSDVAYYLATHKEETRNIADMTPKKMAKAILKIEMKLESQPKQKVVRTTNAPKPITPVSGQSAKSGSINDADNSFEQHEAYLNARTQSTAGGFI